MASRARGPAEAGWKEMVMQNGDLRHLVDDLFAKIERKDLDGVIQCFAEDAVFFDPHYPAPRMAGRRAIRDGLEWSFALLEKFGFPVVNYFENAEHDAAAIEVATAHVLNGGTPMDFPQLFVVEARDGLITRLQSYLPYGPSTPVGEEAEAAASR
jgi:ketosteroid isomerase-like protein